MPAFTTAYDVCNVGAQLLGTARISSFSGSKFAIEAGAAYDREREALLRRYDWRFATRKSVHRAVDITTQLWTPPTYSSTTTYALGAVVVDTTANADWWQSKVGANVGNTPGIGNFWQRYFGPDCFDPFSAPFVSSPAAPATPTLGTSVTGSLGSATYYVKITYVTATGESAPSDEASLAVAANSVLTVTSPVAATGATGWNVYVSTVAGWETKQNSVAINIGTGWTEPTTGLTIGQFPPSSSAVIYSPGELTSYGGNIYLSLVGQNQDTPPTQNWLNVGGTSAQLQILYPIGTGPSVQATTQNVFRLPHGYLKRLHNDPKNDFITVVGVPVGPAPEDWVTENNYLVSRTSTNPIMLRFIANIVDVPQFDPNFAEMLGSRLGWILCETVTQSAEKKADCLQHYKDALNDAKASNGLEVGRQASPIDPWILARY